MSSMVVGRECQPQAKFIGSSGCLLRGGRARVALEFNEPQAPRIPFHTPYPASSSLYHDLSRTRSPYRLTPLTLETTQPTAMTCTTTSTGMTLISFLQKPPGQRKLYLQKMLTISHAPISSTFLLFSYFFSLISLVLLFQRQPVNSPNLVTDSFFPILSNLESARRALRQFTVTNFVIKYEDQQGEKQRSLLSL